MKPPAVSIVIPAYNCEKTIAACLQACLGQIYPGEISLIVVDDGSTDQTAQKIQAHPQVKYIRQDNVGPAAARNRGAVEARTEFICFTDSDCIPQNDWLEKLLRHFDDPQIGVVAGSYGIANPGKRLARCVYAEIRWRHKTLMPKFSKSFGSYNFCVRKNIFEKTEGFDISYRFASGEDNDLSYKIINAGYRIFFAQDALVAHQHPERLRNYLFEQYRHGYWRAKLYLAHPRMSQGDDYTFWKDMVEVLLAMAVAFALVISFWCPSWANVWVSALCMLLILEVFFACFMLPQSNLVDRVYWAGTMALRGFSRTLGFLAGGVYFLWPRPAIKK